jgi:hypothetical protein
MSNWLKAFIRRWGEVNGPVRYKSMLQARHTRGAKQAAERERHYTMIDNLPDDPSAEG